MGDPDVQEAFAALMKAGSEASRWAAIANVADKKMSAQGYPALAGGFTKAPFDTIGDTLRGTTGIAKDMYRHPDKILKSVEILTPLMVEMGLPQGANGSPIVMMPLHKGADGFMSDAQFNKFYWPSLKAVILALIEKGLIPCLFAEGGYNSRLEVINDLPTRKDHLVLRPDRFAEGQRYDWESGLHYGQCSPFLID